MFTTVSQIKMRNKWDKVFNELNVVETIESGKKDILYMNFKVNNLKLLLVSSSVYKGKRCCSKKKHF